MFFNQQVTKYSIFRLEINKNSVNSSHIIFFNFVICEIPSGNSQITKFTLLAIWWKNFTTESDSFLKQIHYLQFDTILFLRPEQNINNRNNGFKTKIFCQKLFPKAKKKIFNIVEAVNFLITQYITHLKKISFSKYCFVE